MRLVHTAATIAFVSIGPASAQSLFGDWWDTPVTTAEYQVQAGGFGSITAALAQAAANGDLGVRPVTINVEPGVYNEANGETFPIVIPAHGVTIEGTELQNIALPLPEIEALTATVVPLEIFLIDSVGNPDLPVSVLRGLNIRNERRDDLRAACVRIAALPSGGGADGRELVAPEIRDCRLAGHGDIGIDIEAQLGTLVVPLIERNLIPGSDPLFQQVGVRIDGWPLDMDPEESGIPEEEWPMTSPFVRSNEILNSLANIAMFDGGYYCRPRIWSNFIRAGQTNVLAVDCAPAILNNTIAFATVSGMTAPPPVALGLSLVDVPELYLSNNCLWNPDGFNFTGVDVAATPAYPLARLPWANFDEDGFLAAIPLAINYDLSVLPTAPGFVAPPADLHLAATSPLIGMGFQFTIAGTDVVPNAMDLGLTPDVVPVRLDNAYDVDFGCRTTTTTVEVGADEFIAQDVERGTRGTRIERVVGSVLPTTPIPTPIPDLDPIGNLEPDANAVPPAWRTQVRVFGTAGDLFLLVAGTGYFDTTTIPGTTSVVDERSPYHHTFNPAGLPAGDSGIDISSPFTNVTVASGVIPGTIGTPGFVDVNVFMPSYAQAFVEAEVFLQALTASPALTAFETSNRMQIDLDDF